MRKVLLITTLIILANKVLLATNKEKLVQAIDKQFFISKIWNYEDQNKPFVNKKKEPLVIYFYANWCVPCRITSPIVEDIAEEYNNKMLVYKVNIDDNKQMAGELGITSIPTFIFIPKNRTPIIYTGTEGSKKETKQMLINISDSILHQ